MRRDAHDIQIQEPPLQEMRKERSCLKRACGTSCGCAFLFLIGLFLFAQFFLRQNAKELKDVPPGFPVEIPVYDRENVQRISYVSGEDEAAWTRKALIVPRAILLPILDAINDGAADTENSFWQALEDALRDPRVDRRERVVIEWQGLSAAPKFIDDYYKKELGKYLFDINVSARTDTVRQFTFAKDGINGVLYIHDDPEKEGTDAVTLTVIYGIK